MKTLHDVITTDGKDVLPSLLGGMIRIPKDPGGGTDAPPLLLGGVVSIPK